MARAFWGGVGGMPLTDESVGETLVRALEGREEPLRQLRSHRTGWGSQTAQ